MFNTVIRAAHAGTHERVLFSISLPLKAGAKCYPFFMRVI